MSYILDALRRADAERERGSVPSIHAQSVPPGSSPSREGRGVHPMVWVVAGLGLALLLSLAWQWVGREPAREPVAAAESAPAPALAPVAAPMPPPVADSSGATAMPTLPPVPATAQQSLPPVPAVKPAPATAAVGPTVKNAAATPAPGASAARVPRQDELPEDIRRQIPQFAVGGSIYSESAASRFIILNGQIFHENDKVLPDLVLEQIKLKSAVLRFRNQRFTISF